jgi:hypothetical protein
MKRVFKVVDHEPTGLLSYTVDCRTYGLVYKLGEWTFPKIGYIFAFDNLLDAQKYISHDTGGYVELYIAIADEVIAPAAGQNWQLSIPEYWDKYAKNKLNNDEQWACDKFPAGTVWTNKLKLIKKYV